MENHDDDSTDQSVVAAPDANSDDNSNGEDLGGGTAFSENTHQWTVAHDLHKHNKWRLWVSLGMAIAIVMAILCLISCFFGIALSANRLFISQYANHFAEVIDLAKKGDLKPTAIMPILMVLIPATFSSILGLLLLITLVRFVSNYSSTEGCKKSNEKDEKISDSVVIEFISLIKSAWGKGK